VPANRILKGHHEIFVSQPFIAPEPPPSLAMKVAGALALLSTLYHATMVAAQPYDMILKQNVDHVFVSVGFTYIDDTQWFDITTLANQFVKDAIVLVTIPQITTSAPGVVKMKKPATLNADKTYSWSMKIVQPNDSFCSKQWYVPAFLAPLQVAWMVFELGSYTVNGFQFIAGKGNVWRRSWTTSATFANGNLVPIYFPTGCVTATDFCVLSATNRGGINLLQTDNNVKEVGKTLYLSVRAKIIDQRRGQWVLIPHDVSTADVAYHVMGNETLGYLVYQTGVKIECFEKMIWETAVDTSVNYIPKTLTYQNTYDYPPGLFGIVGTITSLCDTILKSSNWQTTSGTFSINEDQCVTEESRHITPETVYLVVVGEKQSTTSTYQCYVNFNSALDPTPVPTQYPTRSPSTEPTTLPTFVPSASPTRSPTFSPSSAPTFTPSHSPTFSPSSAPSNSPSTNPSVAPTFSPSSSPSRAPTAGASAAPTSMCSNTFPVEMYRD
jgi:hypothetical protein